ncbi:Zinc finger, RING-type [Dillenia turbinata]|uniref:RING-type E3 ubiquitin transferase n=1 Tax=Dillenia turbinata TaxID=194707 RepID=A0AAN8VRF3_9MAGN
MQGQRSTISPLRQNLRFEHGSSSRSAGMDPDVWWSNVQNPAENLLPDYFLSPPETNCSYLNSLSQERQNCRRSLGESSSSGAQNQITHDERKVEGGWPASVTACAAAGPRLEEREFVLANVPLPDNLNISNQVAESSNSVAIPESTNANIGFEGRDVDNYPGFSCPHFCKSSGPDERALSASCSSDPFSSSSRSGGSIMEESNGRPGCSLEGQRLSCKRKAVEGNGGQPSLSGTSNCLQHAENSAWHSASARPHVGSSLSISTPSENILGVSPSEEVNPRLGLGMRGVGSSSHFSLGAAAIESSRRNFRARINPSRRYRDSAPQTFLPTGNAGQNGNVTGSHQSVRLVSSNLSLDPRTGSAVDSLGPLGQPMRIHSSPIPRNMRSLRLNALSGSRNQINPVISREADPTPSEDANSRSVERLVGEHPMIVATNEPRDPAHNPTNWSLTSGHVSFPGNIASTSRSGSSSGLHPSSAPMWVPHQGPAQHPRPLPEFLRQSMFSFVGSESEGQSSNYSSLGSGPAPPLQEAVRPPAPLSNSASQGRRHSFSRAALRLERHGDGILGIPYSLRTLASAGEGRSRLASEIRNVWDLMRRGEGLRFEDVMILDQSVFFGMADLHDRHRDMRLDVDNMSYEELLALEERIGNVSTGLSEETIWKHLKQRKHLAVVINAQSEEEPCCICQVEYNNGENLGTLDCGHDFHAECIKQWLTHKNICPICKTTGLVA